MIIIKNLNCIKLQAQAGRDNKMPRSAYKSYFALTNTKGTCEDAKCDWYRGTRRKEVNIETETGIRYETDWEKSKTS